LRAAGTAHRSLSAENDVLLYPHLASLAWGCSSDGQSSSFLNCVSGVRLSPAPPLRATSLLADAHYREFDESVHPRGWKLTSMLEVQFVCGVAANTGASHFSYCTLADRLRSL